jgi:hypothetical protein
LISSNVESTTEFENVASAIDWALEHKKCMDEEDKRRLTMALLLVKNNNYWNGTKLGENLRIQEGYKVAHNLAKLLSDIVDDYIENMKHPFVGALVSHGFMKRELYKVVRRGEDDLDTSPEEDQTMEHLWLRRLEPLVNKHMTTEMMNTRIYGYDAYRGPSHPEWLMQVSEEFMIEHFYVAEAGPPFVSSERPMLTLFAKHDANKGDHIDFLYTGRLIDNISYGDGKYESLAFRCLQQRDLWIIPPIEFDVDNSRMVHAAHKIHQQFNT